MELRALHLPEEVRLLLGALIHTERGLAFLSAEINRVQIAQLYPGHTRGAGRGTGGRRGQAISEYEITMAWSTGSLRQGWLWLDHLFLS